MSKKIVHFSFYFNLKIVRFFCRTLYIKNKLREWVAPREWSGRSIKLTTRLHKVARLWTRGAVSPLHQHFRLKGDFHVTHLHNQCNPVQSTPDIASHSQTSSVCEQILSYTAFRFDAAFDKSSLQTCRHKLRWANSDAVSSFECIFFDSSVSRGQLKYDGTRAKTRFRLSAKRTSPFKSAGASVQSTTGSRGVRISGSNAGYTMFRGSVKSTGYPLNSPVSPSLPLLCVTVCHHISTGVYTARGNICEPIWLNVVVIVTPQTLVNPLNPELNPICYLLALLAHHFLHVSRIRVK